MTVQEAEQWMIILDQQCTDIEEECKMNNLKRVEMHPLSGYYNFIYRYKGILGAYVYKQASAVPSGSIAIYGTMAPIPGGSGMQWVNQLQTIRGVAKATRRVGQVKSDEPRNFAEQLKKYRAGIKFFKVFKMKKHFEDKWKNALWSDEEKETVEQIIKLLEKLDNNENWNNNTLKLIQKYDRSK